MFIICCYLESSVHSLQGVVRGRPERVGGLVPPFLAGADDPLIREVPEELAQDCLQLLVTLDLFNVLAFQELIGHVEAVFINGEELKGRDVEAKLLPNIQVILLYFLHVLFTGFLLVPTAHEKNNAALRVPSSPSAIRLVGETVALLSIHSKTIWNTSTVSWENTPMAIGTNFLSYRIPTINCFASSVET